MNHPEREEWIPYIFNEAAPAERKRLGQHLEDCPECAHEVAGWRRSLRKLDRWSVPAASSIPMRHPVARWSPVLNWALAAALVLGIGVSIGRLSLPRETRLAEFRAQLEDSVRASLRAEMNEALDDLQGQMSNTVRATETRLASVSSAENQRLWRSVVDVLGATRAEDKRAVQALLEQIEDQHNAQFVTLRRDLETLASATDDEIRQARLNLMQLASNNAGAQE